jgi:hypothetical protein
MEVQAPHKVQGLAAKVLAGRALLLLGFLTLSAAGAAAIPAEPAEAVSHARPEAAVAARPEAAAHARPEPAVRAKREAAAQAKRRPHTAVVVNPAYAFFIAPPCRLFDSRMPADAPALQTGVARTIQITGICAVPAAAKVVALNVTVTQSTAMGGVELLAGDGTALNLELVDFHAGQTRAGDGLVRLAGDGSGTIKALLSTSTPSQSAHLVLDLTGYFADATPIAVDDSYSTTLNTPLAQSAPGVLANDTLFGAAIFSYGATTGSEQTTIGAATPTSGAGSISLNADGSFSYTPATGFTGSDTFKYVIKNFAGSSTATVTIAVGKGDQTITFTSTAPAGATVGGPTYNVTATATSGLTVTFTIDASATSVCTISGSTVSFIGVGTCVIDANQAGNASYNPAPQVQQSFAVGKGNQTITFTSTAPSSAQVGGPTYNVTATATSALAVTFTIDASASSVCSISGSTVSFLATGTCVIDANQAGDANWNPAPQAQQSFGVGKADQTITFTSTAPAGAKVGGPTYTVTATASSGLTVTFTIDASASTVCSISGSTVSFIGVGTCVIDANQAGDANTNPAPQVQQSFAVAKGDQTINFTSTAPAGAKVGGPTYTVTATATSGLTVAFTIDAVASSVCSISGSTVSFTGAGTCVIDANQAGNANYNAAPQVQQSFTVAKGDQTINFTSTAPAGAKFGGPTYTVTATATSGLTVTFTIDASASSVCSISGSTVSFIGAGTCVIDANQAGNANYNAAPQAQQSFPVAKADQTISFTSTAPTMATPGGPTYTVTATATSGLAVTFTIDASATAFCSISGSTVSFTADGTCVIDANQAGNSNYNAAPQVQQSFVVDTPPTVTSTNPANGATSVPLASTISITFSKPVTVTGTAFALSCSPGTAPGFTVTPASPATTFVLHPAANLPFDSSCTVTVTASQVSDAASRNMVSNYTFSFATPPIAVADTYPETLIGHVSVNSSVIPYSVTTNDQFNSPVTITAFDATSANGGTVSMTPSGAGIGQFTYNPPVGFTGNDTFTYTISNAHGSTTGTVTMPIVGIIWFINDNAGAGDGRLSSPLNSLAAFQAINDGASHHPAANANIFLYDSASAYTGPVTLLNGQRLIGQDATSSLPAITGLTPGASSAALPATGGGSPNKVSITSAGNGVTLGSGNTVWGLSFGNATGTALTGASVGSLKIRDVTINTTGAAVSLANGALDAIIHAISAGGGTHGISLTTTTGSFDVEGGGASDPANTTRGRTTARNGGGTLTLGSGGTIQNATSAGVLLSTATNVTLRNMTIQNNGSGIGTGGDGITVTNGSGLTLDNDLITGQGGNNGLHANGLSGATLEHTEISNNATTAGVESASPKVWNVRFDNVTGTVTADNSLFHHGRENIFGVVATGATTLTLNVTNGEFRDTATTAPGNVGLQLNLNNTANITLAVSGSSFLRNRSNGIEYLGNDSTGGGSFTVATSVFDANAIDINLAHQGLGKTVTFNIHDNTLRQTTGGLSNSIAVGLGSLSNSTTALVGKIQNNVIGTDSVVGSGSSGGNGVVLTPLGAGTITALLKGNIVKQVSGNDSFNMQPFQFTGTVNLTLDTNTFSVDSTSVNSAFGIDIIAGNDAADSGTICANITGNHANGNAGTVGSGLELITGAGNPTVELQGYGGAANDSAMITSFIDSTNTVNPSPAVVSASPGTIKAAPAPCPTPP